MNLSSLLFNQALIASFSISPWRPLLLSLAASLLSLAGLWGLWQSARLLNGWTAKTAWKKESQQLKAQWAFHQLRMIGPKLCIAGISFCLGWLWRDHQFVNNRHSYQDVLVVDRYDARHFLVRPAGMKAYKFDFDTDQDFQPGQVMMVLDYEQRLGVKRIIRADFCPMYCDERGNRKIYREEIANVGY